MGDARNVAVVAQRLSQLATERVRVGALLVGFGLPVAVLVSGPAGVPLSASIYAVNAVMVAGAALLYWLAATRRLPAPCAHPALAMVCLAAPFTTIVTELVTGQVALTAPLLAAVLSVSLQLHARWCVASLVLVLAGWVPTHLHVAPDNDKTAMTILSVVATALLALVYQLVGRRYVVTAETELDERQRAEAERERLRDQLEHAQRLEAVGTLAAGLAHDMNNILAGILGLSEVLLEESPTDAQRADLEAICREATRGAALTHGLLAFSRRGRYRSETLTLDSVVDQILPLLQRTLPKVVTIERTGASTATIVGDPAQLGQIIMNLCLNAADAMPGGGSLTVATGTDGAFGTITVSDTGEGMDEATRARIFEPFFTTKPLGKGTGLGLAMVYGAVQHHGGTIEVASQPGRGTTFLIRLPIGAAIAVPRTTTAARRESEQLRRRGMVLVVDDEPLVRQAATRLLERLGLTVITATNGAEGVEVMRERGADIALVILDMSMPVMGGAECFRRIRELRKVPVLLASGYAVEAEARALLASGAAGFLDKPFSAATLSEHIARILGPLATAAVRSAG